MLTGNENDDKLARKGFSITGNRSVFADEQNVDQSTKGIPRFICSLVGVMLILEFEWHIEL